jgi:DNA-binding transcriptional ArsR family regulator
LADPIRRRILLMLRGRDATAGVIADCFPVSRPAVSRHLRVLREARLVADEMAGRERVYRLQLSALSELEVYLRQLRGASAWEQRFDALATEVHRLKRRRTGGAKSNVRHPRKHTA